MQFIWRNITIFSLLYHRLHKRHFLLLELYVFMEQKKKNLEGEHTWIMMTNISFCSSLNFINIQVETRTGLTPFLLFISLYRYKGWLEKLADISLRQSAAYGFWNFSFNNLYHSTQVWIISFRFIFTLQVLQMFYS